MLTTKTFVQLFQLLLIFPCFESLIQCEFGNYTRNIGVPRAADGIDESQSCSICFAFECNIYEFATKNTTDEKEVRLFGAGCS
uniref:Uncharacterized protein n=1 Tax=Panagrolaimus superbus TaxID=310955 RepID=A0A914YEW2_9BILA